MKDFATRYKTRESWLKYAEVNDNLDGKAQELFIKAIDDHENMLKLRRSIENNLDIDTFSFLHFRRA